MREATARAPRSERVDAIISITETAMYYEERSSALSFLAGLMLGAGIGAGVALLTAPQSGKRTRRQIRRAAVGVRDSATERWGDFTGDMRSVVKSGRRRLQM